MNDLYPESHVLRQLKAVTEEKNAADKDGKRT